MYFPKKCMSSTIHILQLGESRGKEKTFQKRPFISIPQMETFRTWCLQVSGTCNSRWKQWQIRIFKAGAPQALQQHIKIIHFSRLMSLLKSYSVLWKPQTWVYGWSIRQHFLVTWHCWKWSFCRAQKNDPKKKWRWLCRILACLIKGFTWFPGVEEKWLRWSLVP